MVGLITVHSAGALLIEGDLNPLIDKAFAGVKTNKPTDNNPIFWLYDFPQQIIAMN